ncbi:MAG: hypothetical protein AB1443_03460 [Pseudomonadota bacterium]
MIPVRLTADALAGALFALIGLGVVFVAGDYPAGEAARMGPGYFPRLLGMVLMLLGLVVMVMSRRGQAVAVAGSLSLAWLGVPLFWLLLASVGRTGLTGLDLSLAVLLMLAWPVSQPLFWVLAGVGVFAVLLEGSGLMLASLALMLVARRAEPELSWRGALAAWLVLLLVCLVIFVWGLGTPLSVWPRFITA